MQCTLQFSLVFCSVHYIFSLYFAVYTTVSLVFCSVYTVFPCIWGCTLKFPLYFAGYIQLSLVFCSVHYIQFCLVFCRVHYIVLPCILQSTLHSFAFILQCTLHHYSFALYFAEYTTYNFALYFAVYTAFFPCILQYTLQFPLYFAVYTAVSHCILQCTLQFSLVFSSVHCSFPLYFAVLFRKLCICWIWWYMSGSKIRLMSTICRLFITVLPILNGQLCIWNRFFEWGCG